MINSSFSAKTIVYTHQPAQDPEDSLICAGFIFYLCYFIAVTWNPFHLVFVAQWVGISYNEVEEASGFNVGSGDL